MKTQDMAIVKSLVSVAWADGEYHDKEKEMIEGLISAFEANEHEAAFIREYAAEQKSLDDIPLNDLSTDDRLMILQHAVLMTYVDGSQHEDEKKFLHDLVKHLGIPEGLTTEILSVAESRAKRFLNLL